MTVREWVGTCFLEPAAISLSFEAQAFVSGLVAFFWGGMLTVAGLLHGVFRGVKAATNGIVCFLGFLVLELLPDLDGGKIPSLAQ